METQKAAPTCSCGRTDYEEVQVSLSATQKAGVTTMVAPMNFWARICPCERVTFWSKKSK